MKSNLFFAAMTAATLALFVSQTVLADSGSSYLERAGKECTDLRVVEDKLAAQRELIWTELVRIEQKAEMSIGAEVEKISGIQDFIRGYRTELAAKEIQVYEAKLASLSKQQVEKLRTTLAAKRVVIESYVYSKGARSRSLPSGGRCGISTYDLQRELKLPDPTSFIPDDILSVLGLSGVKSSRSVECLTALTSAVQMLDASNETSFTERLVKVKTAKWVSRLNQIWPTGMIGSFAVSTAQSCRASISCSSNAETVSKLVEIVKVEEPNLLRVQAMRSAYDNLDQQVRELGDKLYQKRSALERRLDNSTDLIRQKIERTHSCFVAE